MPPFPTSALDYLWWTLGALAVLALTFSIFAIVRRGPEDNWIVAHLRLFSELYSRFIHGLKIEVADIDPIPTTGPAIVVANHQSGYDPVALSLITRRRIHFLMAKEYFETRGLHWAFRALECIPVRRDGHDLGATKTALKMLRDGRVIGIFPQGGIRDPADFEDAKGGVALLAFRSRAPIVACHISGSPRRKSVLVSVLSPSRTLVRCGVPRHLPPPGSGRPTREEIEAVTQQVLDDIAALSPQAQANPGGNPAAS